MKNSLCLIMLLISISAYSGIINSTLTSSTVSSKESSTFDIESLRKFFTLQDVIACFSNRTKVVSALVSYKKDIIIDSVILKQTRHYGDGGESWIFNIRISKEEVGDGVITTSKLNFNALRLTLHNVNTVDEYEYKIYVNGFKIPIFFRFVYDKTILTER